MIFMTIVSLHKRAHTRQWISGLCSLRCLLTSTMLTTNHNFFFLFMIRFLGRSSGNTCCVLQRRKVLFFLKEVAILRIVIVVIIAKVLILLLCLHLTPIAFLPKWEIQILAIVTHPVALSLLAQRLGLSTHAAVCLLQGSQVLLHLSFFFGF